MTSPSLSSQLASLRGDHEAFGLRVELIAEYLAISGARANVRVYALTRRNDLPTLAEFVDYLKWQLVYFCLPTSERKRIENLVKADPANGYRHMVAAFEKARGLFIRAEKRLSRSGECGELILRVLIEWVLRAPQVVCKMLLKTNSNMPVHGTDGIHLGYDPLNNKLIVYWGESKVHRTLPSALSAAEESMRAYATNADQRKREVQILIDNLDFGPDSEALENFVVKYFNPYEAEHLARYECLTALLAFDEASYEELRLSGDLGAFKAAVRNRADMVISSVEKMTTDKVLDEFTFQFFLLPFASVESLRAQFMSVLEWQ